MLNKICLTIVLMLLLCSANIYADEKKGGSAAIPIGVNETQESVRRYLEEHRNQDIKSEDFPEKIVAHPKTNRGPQNSNTNESTEQNKRSNQ